MSFTAIDPALLAWSNRNRLPLSTTYQDAEVCSFELVGPSGRGRAQIWIEVDGGTITVCVWDYRKRKQSRDASAGDLEAILDDALRTARSWTT
jgi:hypothetical protein